MVFGGQSGGEEGKADVEKVLELCDGATLHGRGKHRMCTAIALTSAHSIPHSRLVPTAARMSSAAARLSSAAARLSPVAATEPTELGGGD